MRKFILISLATLVLLIGGGLAAGNTAITASEKPSYRLNEFKLGQVGLETARGLSTKRIKQGTVVSSSGHGSFKTKNISVGQNTLVAVKWKKGGRPEHLGVLIQKGSVSKEGGHLDYEPEEGPDTNSREYRQSSEYAFSEPFWTGKNAEVAFEVGLKSGESLRDITFIAIQSPDPEQPLWISLLSGISGWTKSAWASAQPGIIKRAQWGADESLRKAAPSYASVLKKAIIHHTAGQNNYTRDESDNIVRSIYYYHTKSRGWNDIGYNFLVDKYGQIFEGRYGGINKNVIGAHASGFNSGSTGVSVMGTFTSVVPTSYTKTALVRLLGWRLSEGVVDPNGWSDFNGLSLPNIIGHRDVGQTSCPGGYLYNYLPTLRTLVDPLINAANVNLSPASIRSGYGATKSLSTTYGHGNGTNNINAASIMVRKDATSTQGAFLAQYRKSINRLYVYSDDSKSLLGGFAPGTPGKKIENSQGVLNVASTKVSESGGRMNISWSITPKEKFVGAQKTFLKVSDKQGGTDGWDKLGAWNIASAPPRNVIPTTPISMTSKRNEYKAITTSYSDPDGANDISYANLMISKTTASMAKAIAVQYKQGKIYMYADDGKTLMGGYAPGAPGILLQNSYGVLSVEHTTVTKSGSQMDIKWVIKAKYPYYGKKGLHAYVADKGVGKDGWDAVGSWTLTNVKPVNQIASFHPTSSFHSNTTYKPQTFTASYSDTDGAYDLRAASLMLSNTTASYAKTIRAQYFQGKLYLYANDGTTRLGGYVPGTAGAKISNAQGTLDVAKTKIIRSGNILTILWSINPKPAFGGTKNAYVASSDYALQSASWQKAGTWKVNYVPINTSLTPATKTSLYGGQQFFDAVYTDSNGADNVFLADLLVADGVSSYAAAILVQYKDGKLYLYSNDGKTAMGGFAPGTAGKKIANSQGILDVEKTTVTKLGNQLKIKWAITPNIAFSGAHKSYMFASDIHGAKSGWVKKGSWKVTGAVTVRGHGWGHGIGMSQWGARDLAQCKSYTYKQILGHYYQGSGLKTISDDQEIKAYIKGNRASGGISGSNTFVVSDIGTGKIISNPASGSWTAARVSIGGAWYFQLHRNGSFVGNYAGPLRFAPLNGAIMAIDGSQYRGSITLRPHGSNLSRFYVVNTLPLKIYLRGLGEMPFSWNIEALKAQVAAARTYAARRIDKPRDSTYDIYSTVDDQVYLGYAQELRTNAANWINAISGTTGQVVTYGGLLAETYYHSESGGHTENNENVWTSGAPINYLRGVRDDYRCSPIVSPRFNWNFNFTNSQIKTKIESYTGGETVIPGSLVDLRPVEWNGPRRVKTVRLYGSGGTIDVKGTTFMFALNLYSRWYWFE